MKIKLSKIMAAVTALGVTFAGFSAMAAITTTTSYDYTNAADVTVSVQTVVDDVAEGSEITYYVHSSTLEAAGVNAGILYIDQQTAGEDKKVTFNFSGVKQGDLYSSATVAKNGSDIKDWTVDTFTFNPGANYISSAADGATHADGTAWYTYTGMTDGVVTDYETDTDEAGVSYKAVVFTGKVEGNPSEYGVKLVDGDTVKKLKALGCDEAGNFVIVLRVNDEDDATWSTVTQNLTNADTYVE